MLIVLAASSCSSLRHGRMFQTDREYMGDTIGYAAAAAERNYMIRPNDRLQVQVYTNNGERIIDPNREFLEGKSNQPPMVETEPRYLVRPNGMVHLPMIGDVSLEGLTLYQADTALARQYARYYEDVYVITKLVNRRVVVIGPLGGKVVPLDNENMNLIEVIALYGGITKEGKAYNIRLIKGDLNNPEVRIIDLSTIEGMRNATLNLQGNEIVYIEPVRKIFQESVRDIMPVFAVLANILTLIILLTNR